MLVLQLRPGEPLWIGDDTTVRILSCDCRAGGKCSVGIEAPRDGEVDRDKVRRDKRAHGRKK